MDCYIYFKAHAEHEAQIILEVNALQLALKQHGVSGNLMCRPVAPQDEERVQGLRTWMEVYRQIPDNFSQLMADCLLTRPALLRLLSGDRHMELFLIVDMPASSSTTASFTSITSFA